MFLNTQRITPAWAGKSIRVAPTPRIAGDHPRTGGEKSDVFRVRVAGEGSPPRRRGKAECQGMPALPHGITPARAGKSQTCPARRSRCRDHPRMGGEKTMYFEDKYFCRGSPPRGRGKVVHLSVSIFSARITPAWAGKRLKRSHRSGIFISGPIPFHSVLHRPAGSGGSRAGRDGSPAGQPQNTGPA